MTWTNEYSHWFNTEDVRGCDVNVGIVQNDKVEREIGDQWTHKVL